MTEARTFADISWSQPYPDRLLDEIAPSDDEPDVVAVERETIGTVNENVEPAPGALSIVIVPPDASTSVLQMYRPRPLPGVPPSWADDSRENFRKSFA